MHRCGLDGTHSVQSGVPVGRCRTRPAGTNDVERVDVSHVGDGDLGRWVGDGHGENDVSLSGRLRDAAYDVVEAVRDHRLANGVHFVPIPA